MAGSLIGSERGPSGGGGPQPLSSGPFSGLSELNARRKIRDRDIRAVLVAVSKAMAETGWGNVDPLPQNITSNVGVFFRQEIFSELIDFCDVL